VPLKVTEVYHKLPLVYNHLMRNIRYDRWAEYIYNISKKYVTKKAAVLDLGSGNGLLTNYLKKYYKNLICTDLSYPMLKANKDKCTKVVCDMTVLPFNSKFDFINCSFDSVNYLLSEIKLKKLFGEINRVLTDEGVFLFDVSLEKNSFKHALIPYSKGKYLGVQYINKSEYDPSRRIHTNVFYIIENGVKYTEVHKQRIYEFETYFKLFEKTGLYAVECYDAFSFNNAHSDCERLQFVIKKVL
jgi:ubiquinone/menaquinone biosynthesis C-methylase UbiE